MEMMNGSALTKTGGGEGADDQEKGVLSIVDIDFDVQVGYLLLVSSEKSWLLMALNFHPFAVLIALWSVTGLRGEKAVGSYPDTPTLKLCAMDKLINLSVPQFLRL